MADYGKTLIVKMNLRDHNNSQIRIRARQDNQPSQCQAQSSSTLRNNAPFLIIAIILTITRIILAYMTPVLLTMAPFDDGLLYKYAVSISHGDWLGQYSFLTLAKNPDYSLLLALCGITGIRYQMLFALLHVLSCIIACIAIRPLVSDKRILLIIYALFLWIPALFMLEFFERVYRDGIVIPFALVVVSCCIALYLRRSRPLLELLPWSLCLALFLPFFFLITESSSWILPFVICACLILIGYWIFLFARHRTALFHLLLRILLICIPLITTSGWIFIESHINASKYSLDVNNARYQGNFAWACHELLSIEANCNDIDVWVSNNALEQALDASPTLASKASALQPSWDLWIQQSNHDGEIIGDYAFWALIMMTIGDVDGMEDGEAFDFYWSKVAAELDSAFSSGKLTRKKGVYIAQTIQPITYDRIPDLVKSTVYYSTKNALYKNDERIVGTWKADYTVDGETLEEEYNARSFLGGNTLVESEEDDTLEKRSFVESLNRIAYTFFVFVYRILAILFIPACLALAIIDIRHKNSHGIETALTVSGLLLTCLTLVAGVCWAQHFNFAADPTIHQWVISMYSAGFHPLFALCMALVFGRLVMQFGKRCKHQKKLHSG